MKLLIVVVALMLSGCGGYSMTPQLQEARARANAGSSEDVAFCKYEAAKAPVYGGSKFNDSSLQNLESNERQMQVFNACMVYRQR